MLFHEIYGSYYQVTASVLRKAVKGTLTKQELTEIVRQQAFSESILTIPQGLTGDRWRLLRQDLSTPIQHPPTMPLTLLQKRWLKSLLLDPRIRLFDPDTTGLEDVEPLFTPDMFIWYDRYGDGDDYADPAYISRFHTILAALEESRALFVRFDTGRSETRALSVIPHHLEYSEKDDRFRLVATGKRRGRWVINLSRMTECCLSEPTDVAAVPADDRASLTFELIDRRNALERVLLHFSHLEKETERLGQGRYRVTLRYDPQDETEMVIRVLAFGSVIRVLEPRRFVELLRQRIERQMSFEGFLPGYYGKPATESVAETAEAPGQRAERCDNKD